MMGTGLEMKPDIEPAARWKRFELRIRGNSPTDRSSNLPGDAEPEIQVFLNVTAVRLSFSRDYHFALAHIFIPIIHGHDHFDIIDSIGF